MIPKGSVLIVDDEFGPRESLRMILKPIYDVHAVENGREALNFIHKEPVDLVTLDLKMPGLSGIDVLRVVANQRRAWTRPYDAIGRYGRETFLLVLPGCEAEAAVAKVEKIRRAVSTLTVNGTASKQERITLSAGVTDGRGQMRALIRGAERAMMRAKRAGGNRVEVS